MITLLLVNVIPDRVLRGADLTFVPPSILELNSLGVVAEPTQRSFKRVQTAPPAVFSSPHRSFFAHTAAPSRTRCQGLMVFLANNEIKALPLEFFRLSNLTVLSLRACSLALLLLPGVVIASTRE